ncbi:MAG: hypothetical protein ACQEP3_00150 [Patescibacteria group bacterium]
MFSKFKKENRLYRIITGLIFFSLIIAFPISLWEQNWLNLFSIGLTLLFFAVIEVVQDKYDFRLPGELKLIILLLIYTGIFLGGMRDLYNRFWWFDSFLHTISGVGLGFLGFLIPYSLYKTDKLDSSPLFIALFGFSFAVSLGVLWEIFEFGMDHFFQMNMQNAENLELIYGYFDTRLGVIDTMHDLILDSLGALVASVVGYIYLKKGEFFLFDKLIKKVEDKNPEYFNNNA